MQTMSPLTSYLLYWPFERGHRHWIIYFQALSKEILSLFLIINVLKLLRENRILRLLISFWHVLFEEVLSMNVSKQIQWIFQWKHALKVLLQMIHSDENCTHHHSSICLFFDSLKHTNLLRHFIKVGAKGYTFYLDRWFQTDLKTYTDIKQYHK